MRSLLIIIMISIMGVSNAQNVFNFNKDHDALYVKELNKSAQFYKEILGLTEIENAGLGQKFRWFKLNDDVQIHLIQSDKEILKDKGVHYAINTENLDAFMKFLKTKGIHFENWAGEPEITNIRPDGVRQIYLQDPEGYWIEINDNSLK